MTDPLPLWQSLAQRYQAVEVTLADCGCFCVQLFANGFKICEEDKDLLAALIAAEKKAAEETRAAK